MTDHPLRRRTILAAVAAAALHPVLPLTARSQAAPPAPTDSLRLGALHADAVARDPRGRQLDLLASQGALRQRRIDAERLPALAITAQGQYQSDVVAVPFQLPGGGTPPLPPHDNYDAHLAARQQLYDPSRAPRRALERARVVESQARVRSSLHALRQSVNDAFFAALLAQTQHAEVEAGIAGLEAQRRVAVERVRGGMALPSETAMLEAEMLRRRQTLAELAARRDAALIVLGELTGRSATAIDRLALPDLAAAFARARAASGDLRARPEYAQYAGSRELIDRQRAVVAARERPRVSAFARAGYGRPGLNPLARDFDEYWLAGIQVEWTPWSWGATDREREELAIQQQIVATEEAAFSDALRRGAENDLAAADRLERALADDEEIIALRERILREARLRFAEGVITSAEYVDRESDVLAARLARATHRVELAQSHARFLTLIGLEVR